MKSEIYDKLITALICGYADGTKALSTRPAIFSLSLLWRRRQIENNVNFVFFTNPETKVAKRADSRSMHRVSDRDRQRANANATDSRSHHVSVRDCQSTRSPRQREAAAASTLVVTQIDPTGTAAPSKITKLEPLRISMEHKSHKAQTHAATCT